MDRLPAPALHEDGHKSSLAFRTISEVSQEIDVPQHVLRFWESRFSQIKPLKRGGGRRYYRPEDIELLRSIKNFLYKQGYTIKGVQRLLKEVGRGRESTPSFDAYRIAGQKGDDVAQEIPPEDFTQAFQENVSEAAAEAVSAPVAADPVERGLNAVSEIHDALQDPAAPMRVEAPVNAARQTELRTMLAELIALRDLLRTSSQE